MNTDFTRDRYGRPMITSPDGGKPEPYSRFSSHGSCLEDRFGLERWKVRTAGKGLASRADLFAQIAATPADDTRRLDALMEQALEAGGGSFGAGLGTALHEFAQHVDNGAMTTANIPAPWDADIAAYTATLADAGLTIEPGLVEVSLVHDGLRLAGTADRFLRRADGRLVCADLKTGKAIGANPLGYAVQLAAYATAQGYDIATGKRWDIGDVDHTVGLLIHVPAGRGECHLIEVDLVAALEAAYLASTVKSWQKRKDIVRKVSVLSRGNVGTDTGEGVTVEHSPAPVTPEPTIDDRAIANVLAEFPNAELVATAEHRAWVEKRVRRIIGFGDAATQELVSRWPADVPKLRETMNHTVSQIEAIGQACSDTERTFELPFPDHNPNQPTVAPEPETPKPRVVETIDEGGEASRYLIDELRTTIESLPDNQRALIADITKEATTARRGISIRQNPSQRRCAIAAMLIHLVRFDDTELMTAIVAHVHPRHSNETLGGQIGRMTINDATTISALAIKVHDGDLRFTISDDGVVVIAETQPNPTKKEVAK